MGRGKIRESIRRAQAAEIAGELDEAVRHLVDAARLHVENHEEARAAVLVRHGLRLRPQHPELRELLQKVGAAEQALTIPEEPVKVVEVSDPDLPHAVSARTVPEEPLRVVELEGSGQGELPGGAGLVVPQRGPTLANPQDDHWCSFCCRPKAEAGPMVAGPAGAFICVKCLEVSGRLLAGAAGQVEKPGEEPAAEAAPEAAKPASAGSRAALEPACELDFIEAAVVLSKKLGWGLSELRSLSREEDPEGAQEARGAG
ncbi:MAG: ClpX C4-type zinc finger protein [Myxococcales bacterium]